MSNNTARKTASDVRHGSGAQVLRIPPPLYYGAAFAGGIWLHTVSTPLAIGGRPATALLGAGIFTAGATLSAAGVAEVLRQRTTIVPHRRVSRLVTTGAYRISRNPMYTGLAIAYLGGALLVGSAWPLVTLPLALLAVRGFVIGPEERYLADSFGQSYADYLARVRRWL
jgi:protein-S-isoprenylcysteine O-methyltransferase Ste14